MLFDKISPQVNSVISFQKDTASEAYTHEKYTCSYKLIIVLKGSMIFNDGEKEERCEAGDIIYLPACCDYSTTFFCEPLHIVDIGFDMTGSQTEARLITRNFMYRGEAKENFYFAKVVKFDDYQYFNKSFVVRNISGAAGRARQCEALFASRKKSFSMLRLNMQVMELLVDIAEKMYVNTPKPRTEIVADNVVEYIEKHCGDKLTCGSVAEEFAYHPASLNRIMKETRGISLHKAILNAKIDFSVHLLLETNMSIAEIAQQLYFYDSAHFTKSFQSVTGHSPSYFRKNERNI